MNFSLSHMWNICVCVRVVTISVPLSINKSAQTPHMTIELSRLSCLLLSLNDVTANHRPLDRRATSSRLADVWGLLDPDGCFSSCVDVSDGTIKDLTSQTWPALCALRVHFSASFLVTDCDCIQIQAHAQNFNTYRGCFHFIVAESIFHPFMSRRHIKSEEMTFLFNVGEFHSPDSFLISDHLFLQPFSSLVPSVSSLLSISLLSDMIFLN